MPESRSLCLMTSSYRTITSKVIFSHEEPRTYIKANIFWKYNVIEEICKPFHFVTSHTLTELRE